jgi:homospermidine synthase
VDSYKARIGAGKEEKKMPNNKKSENKSNKKAAGRWFD